MKSVTKLKDDARKHEQKEEWDKAIQAYLQVLKTGEEGEGELDLPLYNRVGDLYLRLSKPNDAVRYYVQAADRYAEAGLFNNAIALCNKAMRYVPNEMELLRKLGQFSASQGFLTDARRYFLEFAEKKFAGGAVDEALTALEEFADASGEPEVRVMLARQLHSHGRTDEAVSELIKAHAALVTSGEHAAADSLSAEIEELAPGSMAAAPPPSKPSWSAPAPSAPAPAAPAEGDHGFEISLPGDDADAQDASLDGFESTHFDAAAPEEAGDFQLQGFETTHAEPEIESPGESFSLPDFESTAHEDSAVTSDDLGLESTIFEPPAELEAGALPDLQFDDTSFSDDASADDTADDGAFDLPMLDDADAEADVAFDGAADSGDFALPDFQMEVAGESHDDADDESAGGFELPMLDDEGDGGSDETSDFALPTFDTGEAETEEHDAGMDLPMLAADDVEHAPAGLDEAGLDAFGEHGGGYGAIEAEDEEAAEEDSEAAAIDAEIAAWRPDPVDHAAEAEAATQPDFAPAEDAQLAGEEAFDAPGGWDPSALGFDSPPAAPEKPAAKSKPKDDGKYIDLGAFLAEDDGDDVGTRFRVQEKAPTGDEDRDFAELLSQFKQKVSENVSAEDSAAHYDLGLAFKEMGLVDEAISEFQIAMRAGDMRLRVYEELGQCFLLKDQYNIAEKVLNRALDMDHKDEGDLIGVYYHLGRAYEGLGNRDAARDSYERVLGLDINFQDVALRLKKL